MNAACSAFVDTFIELSDAMRSVYQETHDYWYPKEPPITVLFSEFGFRMVDDFYNNPQALNEKMFQQIELAMMSDNEQLGIAVATGLIESIVSDYAIGKGVLEEMMSMFGLQSHKHAVAWMRFEV